MTPCIRQHQVAGSSRLIGVSTAGQQQCFDDDNSLFAAAAVVALSLHQFGGVAPALAGVLELSREGAEQVLQRGTLFTFRGS